MISRTQVKRSISTIAVLVTLSAALTGPLFAAGPSFDGINLLGVDARDTREMPVNLIPQSCGPVDHEATNHCHQVNQVLSGVDGLTELVRGEGEAADVVLAGNQHGQGDRIEAIRFEVRTVKPTGVEVNTIELTLDELEVYMEFGFDELIFLQHQRLAAATRILDRELKIQEENRFQRLINRRPRASSRIMGVAHASLTAARARESLQRLETGKRLFDRFDQDQVRQAITEIIHMD